MVRDLLPTPRKALLLRSGEQNLHRSSASPPASGGFFSGAICSPPPAKPCCFVSGSKIFTEVPHRRLQAASFPTARFAPRSSQSFVASFRGAKSSQKFRAAACHRRPFQRRDLLPAKPCAIVPGSKIFTEIPRRHLPPAADPVGAASPAKPYITVGSRQQGAQNPARRPTMLALSRRQSLMPPSGHANRAPQIPLGGRPCWRRHAGKAIYRRRATPTGRPGYEGREKDCRYLSPAKHSISICSLKGFNKETEL